MRNDKKSTFGDKQISSFRSQLPTIHEKISRIWTFSPSNECKCARVSQQQQYLKLCKFANVEKVSNFYWKRRNGTKRKLSTQNSKPKSKLLSPGLIEFEKRKWTEWKRNFFIRLGEKWGRSDVMYRLVCLRWSEHRRKSETKTHFWVFRRLSWSTIWEKGWID